MANPTMTHELSTDVETLTRLASAAVQNGARVYTRRVELRAGDTWRTVSLRVDITTIPPQLPQPRTYELVRSRFSAPDAGLFIRSGLPNLLEATETDTDPDQGALLTHPTFSDSPGASLSRLAPGTEWGIPACWHASWQQRPSITPTIRPLVNATSGFLSSVHELQAEALSLPERGRDGRTRWDLEGFHLVVADDRLRFSSLRRAAKSLQVSVAGSLLGESSLVGRSWSPGETFQYVIAPVANEMQLELPEETHGLDLVLLGADDDILHHFHECLHHPQPRELSVLHPTVDNLEPIREMLLSGENEAVEFKPWIELTQREKRQKEKKSLQNAMRSSARLFPSPTRKAARFCSGSRTTPVSSTGRRRDRPEPHYTDPCHRPGRNTATV